MERSQAVTASFDGDIRLWQVPSSSDEENAHSNKKIVAAAEEGRCELILKGHLGAVAVVEECVTSTGVDTILSGSLDSTAIQWDLEMGKVGFSTFHPHNTFHSFCHFSDGINVPLAFRCFILTE